MKFTKSNKPSDIPFGVYRFDHELLKSLRKADANIIDPEENDRYCGPVFSATCENGPVAFFVPIDPVYEKMAWFVSTFNDGVYAGVFDLKRMIPCVDSRFITPDESNAALSSFCKNSFDELADYADSIMRMKHPDINID